MTPKSPSESPSDFRVLSPARSSANRNSEVLAQHDVLRRQHIRLWSVMLTLTGIAAFAALTSMNAYAQTPEPGRPPAGTSTTTYPIPQATPGPAAQTAGPSVHHPKYAAQDLARAFGFLDTNSDGKISRAEAAGVKNVAKYFDPADTNRDQALSRQEFDAAMNTTRPQ